MKKLIIISLLSVFFTPKTFSQVQENPCAVLLQQGLYKYYLQHSSGNYMQDLKNYFTSDLFKSDYQNHKWLGSIGVILDAVPVSLGANASSDEIHSFQQQIRQSTNFQISSNFNNVAIQAIPDDDLAKTYSDCVQNIPHPGFKIYPSIAGNSITFVISYKKNNSRDPMPKVTFFRIQNGQNVQNGLSVGEEIRDNMVIICDRKPDDDVTLTIETDRETATQTVSGEATGFKDFPVGTIIASYLNFDQFNGVTKNNEKSPTGTWSSRYSKYAPCDGRQVPNSGFVNAANVLNVPDLRGVFLRGLNQFDPNELSIVNNNMANPDNKKIGEFQSDAVGQHTHKIDMRTGYMMDLSKFSNPPPASIYVADRPAWHDAYGQLNALPDINAKETRPKNISVYYYIRINN